MCHRFSMFGVIGSFFVFSRGFNGLFPVRQWRTLQRWHRQWTAALSMQTVPLSLHSREKADEMHTYAGKKNYRRLWIAVNRLGKRFISFVCGGHSAQTGLKLWDRLKAETFMVEGYHSRIRHYLARFKRKTKC